MAELPHTLVRRAVEEYLDADGTLEIVDGDRPGLVAVQYTPKYAGPRTRVHQFQIIAEPPYTLDRVIGAIEEVEFTTWPPTQGGSR